MLTRHWKRWWHWICLAKVCRIWVWFRVQTSRTKP